MSRNWCFWGFDSLADLSLNRSNKVKQTINEHQFRQAFKECRPDQFSWEGLHALWEWFEQYEEDTSEDIELDVIAICCDYSEYANFEEFKEEYLNFCMNYDIDEFKEFSEVIEDHNIILIPIENSEGFIIQQF